MAQTALEALVVHGRIRRLEVDTLWLCELLRVCSGTRSQTSALISWPGPQRLAKSLKQVKESTCRYDARTGIFLYEAIFTSGRASFSILYGLTAYTEHSI